MNAVYVTKHLHFSRQLSPVRVAISLCPFGTTVTMTARDGRVSKLEQVYLRGSHIKLVVLPDVLKNAPVFKPVQKMKKKDEEAGGGRGGGFKKSKKPKP